MLCPCGSCKPFSLCCEPYYSILNLKQNCPDTDKILIDWLEKYSEPIEKTFMSKTEVYIFRISLYFNKIFDSYFTLGFKPYLLQQKELDNQIISIKLNILHSLIASLSCLSQGLFLQSGIILRSLIEDCLVLLDISENDEQLQNLLAKHIQSII